MHYKFLYEWRPARFILVGILNTLIGYTVFAFLLLFGLKSSVALLLTTCIGIMVNFKTISSLVFNQNDNRLFIKFVLLYGLIYLLNLGLLHIANWFLGNLYLSGIISILFCTIPSYLGNKIFIFKNNCDRMTPI